MTTMRLQSYLTTMFPNVQMKRPLFYNAPAGIRFTLTNQKGVWEREYMKNVYARAYEIFEHSMKKMMSCYLFSKRMLHRMIYF